MKKRLLNHLRKKLGHVRLAPEVAREALEMLAPKIDALLDRVVNGPFMEEAAKRAAEKALAQARAAAEKAQAKVNAAAEDGSDQPRAKSKGKPSGKTKPAGNGSTQHDQADPGGSPTDGNPPPATSEKPAA